MADQNKCRDLKITDAFSGVDDALVEMFKLQKQIQEDQYGVDFEHMRASMGRVYDYFIVNYSAVIDEMGELREALGGMDTYRNALWKPWKTDHQDAKARSFSQLNEGELKELQFEVVDIFHFVINMAIMVDMTPEQVMNMYYAKNRENIRRVNENY